MNYFDFDIEVGTGVGLEYPVRVLHSPAGEARETMRFPFDARAAENALLKLENALLRSGGTRRQAFSPEQQAVQDFGRALFDGLLTGDVRTLYDRSLEHAQRENGGLRVRLRIEDPKLAALPWEFLYDHRQAEFVCLSRDTPVVRYLQIPQPIRPLVVPGPLRILGMIASPVDMRRLDVEGERRRVDQAISTLGRAGLVEITWLDGQTWRDLQRAMRGGPWHVLHYIGHGGFSEVADEGLIYLADEDGHAKALNASELGRLLASHHSLRLVFLSACEGARGSRQDVFSSTAATLVRRGLPAALAMQYSVTDAAAIELARTFYEALAEGYPVDAAVAEARVAVSLALSNTLEWGVPVLYMRSTDGVLFQQQPLPATREPAAVQRDTGRPPQPSQVRGAAPGPPVEVRAAKPVSPPPWHTLAPSTGKILAITTPINVELVQIPAGVFFMGTQSDVLGKLLERFGGEGVWYKDEQPGKRVELAAYHISKFPITNLQYAAFVRDANTSSPKHWRRGTIPTGKENHPVVNVSWHDAVVFCQWLAKTSGLWVRLPAESEWEKAARGVDGRIFPWGNDDPTADLCNFAGAKIGDTSPVDRYPGGASPYQVWDMAGNIWEWTGSAQSLVPETYKSPFKSPNHGHLPDESLSHVVRGGSFNDAAMNIRCAVRPARFPNYVRNDTGFRIVIADLAR